MSKISAIVTRLIWFHIVISIFCCLARNDLNLIPLFLLIALLDSSYYVSYSKICSKIIFQTIIAMLVYDLLWVIIMGFVWNHGGSSSTTSYVKYWDSLSFMHTVIYLLAFVEMAFKTVMAYFAFLLYKENSGASTKGVKDLLSFNYANEKPNSGMNDSNRNVDNPTGRV